MKAVIDSYRQQLSDTVHKATLQELHIEALKEALANRDEKIKDLQSIVDIYEKPQNPAEDDGLE